MSTLIARLFVASLDVLTTSKGSLYEESKSVSSFYEFFKASL